jgi:hypothetical protein
MSTRRGWKRTKTKSSGDVLFAQMQSDANAAHMKNKNTKDACKAHMQNTHAKSKSKCRSECGTAEKRAGKNIFLFYEKCMTAEGSSHG